MKQVKKILAKENHFNLKKSQGYKSEITELKKGLKAAHFKVKIKDDFDFFQAEVLYRGLLNKNTFQNSYEKTRYQLIDLWESINNNERLDFVNRDLEKIKHNLFHFKVKETIIWIPFFDDLFNNLYDHSMTIFENKQYFHIFKDFQKQVINIATYHYLPYQAGFSSAKYILGTKKEFVLYYPEMRTLYLIKDYRLIDKILLPDEYNQKIITKLANYFLNGDAIGISSYLLDEKLVSEKISKRLNKYLIKERQK